MPERNYQQQEDRHTQERADDKTNMALIRQDMKYMRADMSEVKSELRDLKQFYVTKDQATALQKDLENRINNVEGRVSLIIKIGVAALLAFTSAIVAAIAKLIFKV